MVAEEQEGQDDHSASQSDERTTLLEHRHEAVEYALLGLLRDGSGHGYRLAAAFGPSGRLGLIVRLKMSQMYAYLHKLERVGWLTVTDEAGAATGRQSARDAGRLRRMFTLTAAGKAAFDTWLATPLSATRDMRLTFLLKLAFVIQDREQALRLVASQREATKAWLARLRAREARIRREAGDDASAENAPAQQEPNSDEHLIELLTIRQRIHLSEATLAWLNETHILLTTQRRAGG